MTGPAPDLAAQRAYSRNVSLFYVYRFLHNLQLWVSIWVLYLQHERGLTLTQITLMDVPFWLLIVFAEIPTGAIADRWGRKLSLLLGAFSFALAIFLFGVATNFWWLLASYLLWGLSSTLQSGADTAFLYESLAAVGREGEFRKALSRAQAVTIAASLTGALIGAPLAAATSLAFPIVVSAGFALLAALVVLTFREPVRHESETRLSYRSIVREAGRHALRRPPLRSMIVLRAVLMGGGMAAMIFTQPFLASHDVPVGEFGVLTTLVRLLSIAGALLAYRAVASFGEHTIFYALAAGIAGALFVLAAVPSVLAFGMFAVLSFCNASVAPLTADYINRHSPAHLRATLASVGQMAFSVVLIAAEPGMGAIADQASLRTAFLVAAVTVSLLALPALVAWTAAARAERRAEICSEPSVVAVD